MGASLNVVHSLPPLPNQPTVLRSICSIPGLCPGTSVSLGAEMLCKIGEVDKEARHNGDWGVHSINGLTIDYKTILAFE